jgi:hypothetical protein
MWTSKYLNCRTYGILFWQYIRMEAMSYETPVILLHMNCSVADILYVPSVVVESMSYLFYYS